jgi:hypothetical protein
MHPHPAPFRWCDDCNVEVLDCEHFAREHKLAKIEENQAGRAGEAETRAQQAAYIASTQALSEWFRQNPEREDWTSAPTPWAFWALDITRIRDGIANPDGSDHGPRCICNKCFDPNGNLDDEYFFVVDGVGALVVGYREIPDLLAQYPNARRVTK